MFPSVLCSAMCICYRVWNAPFQCIIPLPSRRFCILCQLYSLSCSLTMKEKYTAHLKEMPLELSLMALCPFKQCGLFGSHYHFCLLIIKSKAAMLMNSSTFIMHLLMRVWLKKKKHTECKCCISWFCTLKCRQVRYKINHINTEDYTNDCLV